MYGLYSRAASNQERPMMARVRDIVGMIADQNFYDLCLTFFYPTASATAYGQRPKFVRAKHSATAEGENCTYGPTL